MQPLIVVIAHWTPWPVNTPLGRVVERQLQMKIACRFRALRDSAPRRNEAAAAQLQHATILLSSGHGRRFICLAASGVLAVLQRDLGQCITFGLSASIPQLIEVAEVPLLAAW